MTAWSRGDWHIFFSSDPEPGEAVVRGFCSCGEWTAERDFDAGLMWSFATDEDRARAELGEEHEMHWKGVRK